MGLRPRSLFAAALSAALVLSLAGPAWAASDRFNERSLVVLSGTVHVDSGEAVDGVVLFHGSLTVDGTVDGSVVVFDGPVSISGTVSDDVTVFNGDVTVASTAHIGGDLSSRTAPTVEQGATIDGRVRRFRGNYEVKFGFASRLAVGIAVTISAFLLGLFLLLFAPRAADAVYATGRSKVGASIGIGFAIFFGFPIVAIIALVTLVGIPLGLGMLLALFLLYWVGYTWGAWFLGRLILGPPRARLVSFLLGLVILRLIALIPIVGGVVWFAASVYGLGMMTVAAFRSRRTAPVPPPPPAAPVPVSG